MSLSAVPALGLLLLLVLSYPKEAAPEIKTPSKKAQPAAPTKKVVTPKKVKPKAPSKKPQVSQILNSEKRSDLDYKTILTYIKNKYKQIKEDDAKKISQYLVDYGKEKDVDPKFTAALIARESAFNKKAVSSTGAKGLGQIKDFNYKSLEIEDPFSIKENVKGTTSYIKTLLNQWNKEKPKKSGTGEKIQAPKSAQSEKIRLALASYYKGFTAVKKDNGHLDEKTEGYVNDILKKYHEIKGVKKDLEKNGH